MKQRNDVITSTPMRRSITRFTRILVVLAYVIDTLTRC